MRIEFFEVLPGQRFLSERTGDRVCTRLDRAYQHMEGERVRFRNTFVEGDALSPPTLIYLDEREMVEVVENAHPSSKEGSIEGVELEAKELCHEGDFSG